MMTQSAIPSLSSRPIFALTGGPRPDPNPAKTPAPTAESKSQPPIAEPFILRRVGLIDGTFSVFVDLISQTPTETLTARLFGPSDHAARVAHAAQRAHSATSAYSSANSGSGSSLAVVA